MTRVATNLEIISTDWLDAMRRDDIDAMSARLAPDVVHQGIHQDLICRNRDEVLHNLRRRAGRVPPVEALELVASGDHVVMSVRAPGVGVPVDEAGEPRGQAVIVFTLRDGVIVRMDDYERRDDALAAAGARVDWD